MGSLSTLSKFVLSSANCTLNGFIQVKERLFDVCYWPIRTVGLASRVFTVLIVEDGSVNDLRPLTQGLKLAFTARYGNDRNERMQVFNTEVEIPHKVELEIGYIQGWGAQYECPSIEYDVTGKANFLKDSANQPEDLMKILMCLICLLLVDYTSGPHLCPGEKVLLVRKDYADGPPKTCEKKSYLAGYMIAPHESQEINNFLYEGNFNLMSVLWLLSEFALIKFCNGI